MQTTFLEKFSENLILENNLLIFRLLHTLTLRLHPPDPVDGLLNGVHVSDDKGKFLVGFAHLRVGKMTLDKSQNIAEKRRLVERRLTVLDEKASEGVLLEGNPVEV